MFPHAYAQNAQDIVCISRITITLYTHIIVTQISWDAPRGGPQDVRPTSHISKWQLRVDTNRFSEIVFFLGHVQCMDGCHCVYLSRVLRCDINVKEVNKRFYCYTTFACGFSWPFKCASQSPNNTDTRQSKCIR